MERSITDTFRDRVVFITGCTRFLGTKLLEKLLRSCDVKTIAVLVRAKKGLIASERAVDIYKQNVFDRLRFEKPDFVTKIKIIDGNLKEHSLGVSTYDYNWMINNVNFVFHYAATIRFNETLQTKIKINIQGTSVVHVSTAYSHCPKNIISEEFYPVPITPKELKNMFIDEISCAK